MGDESKLAARCSPTWADELENGFGGVCARFLSLYFSRVAAFKLLACATGEVYSNHLSFRGYTSNNWWRMNHQLLSYMPVYTLVSIIRKLFDNNFPISFAHNWSMCNETYFPSILAFAKLTSFYACSVIFYFFKMITFIERIPTFDLSLSIVHCFCLCNNNARV